MKRFISLVFVLFALICMLAVTGCSVSWTEEEIKNAKSVEITCYDNHGSSDAVEIYTITDEKEVNSICNTFSLLVVKKAKITEPNDSRYSSYGMGFVKFAAEEKQLFRWLYLEGRQSGPYSADVLYSEIIGVVVDEFGYSEEVARRFHRDMLYFTYGLAILANTDHLNLTEYELREAFRREFRALTAIYGKPSKLPDFAVKEGIVL